jgi:hypothetical protein
MKLVIQSQNSTQVRRLEEKELESTIEQIKRSVKGSVVPPKSYEKFRYRLEKGVIVIYGDNRVQRAQNFWFEMRALACIAQEWGMKFTYGAKMRFPNDQETEVDGIDTDTGQIMVEVKRAIITQEWVAYYEHKRERLGMRECWVVAPLFDRSIHFPPTVRGFIFEPDLKTLTEYYRERFAVPTWIEPFLPTRHIRILLGSGRWQGIQRQLTYTAKHTPTTKLALILQNLFLQRKDPVRIYYSLAPMVRPIAEFFAKGLPLPKAIAAFDVDANHKQHVIGPEGYCIECLAQAENKANLVAQQLSAMGEKFQRVYSGAKGFHFYLVEEKPEIFVKELRFDQINQYCMSLTDPAGVPLLDNVNFRSNAGFDAHRIFKMPNTVDSATGLIVQADLEKIRFNDKLTEIC